MRFIPRHDYVRLAKVCDICGFEMDDLIRDTGIMPSDALDGGGDWDLESLRKLYGSAQRRSTKGYFPFVLSENFLFDRIPEVELYLASSPTIGDTLWILGYLPCLVQENIHCWVDLEGELANIYFEIIDAGRSVSFPGFLEAITLYVQRSINQILKRKADTLVSFSHSPQIDIHAYERQFGLTPVFNDRCTRISLKLSDAEQQVKSRSSSLHAQASLLLEGKIRELQAKSGLLRSMEVLLSHNPSMSLENVCEALGIEQRSLQRRLKDAGTTFNTLQGALRFQRAKTLLVEMNLDIDSVAIKLGFSDRNSFSKAFSKWSGLPPSQYKRNFMKA